MRKKEKNKKNKKNKIIGSCMGQKKREKNTPNAVICAPNSSNRAHFPLSALVGIQYVSMYA